MTHYEILGIRKTATTEEIKDAYKKLVKKYHPDVYVGDKTFAEKKIKEINEAYEVLSDPTKKSEYDDLISPNTSTSYSPPDYEGYTYRPSYEKVKTSKRKAQAQGSKYSYENYKKTYNSQSSYDYQRRYTDFHRSKTPNSNYTGSNVDQNAVNQETIKDLTAASKPIIIIIILFFYAIYFISSITNLLGTLSHNDYNQDSITTQTEVETETETSTENSESEYESTYDSYDDYFYNTYINKTEEEKEENKTETDSAEYETVVIEPESSEDKHVTEENFDINTIYSDSELRSVYNSFFTEVYPTFEEFKADFSHYYYQKYQLYY